MFGDNKNMTEVMACNVTIATKTTSSYFNLSLFFTHSCRFLKRCLQCTENMESLSSTTKNRWDECSTAAKMLVECVEHYYAKRCKVVSWLFLSVTYKIKKENIKFIITQNVTNHLLIRKNCFLCFRLNVFEIHSTSSFTSSKSFSCSSFSDSENFYGYLFVL